MTGNETATVTARGDAVVPGTPDEGAWDLQIVARAATADAAMAEVRDRSATLQALFDELQVAKDQRSTTGVSVNEEFDYIDGKQTSRGFSASNQLTVRLGDPSDAGRMITEAITRAGAAVHGPRWWIAPDNPARVEACKRAAAVATRKAEAYAEALGLRLGRVLEVREPSVGGVPFRNMRTPMHLTVAATEEPIDIDPGLLDVTATVDVTYSLR
ncbi:MAG TPA: SIMPL domain-containing protein [Actinomycetota bacterium]|nr:SIMPL domain-containing protein [Actinomycetota bacterium]